MKREWDAKWIRNHAISERKPGTTGLGVYAHYEVVMWMDYILELERQAAVMREALEDVNWIRDEDLPESERWCAWCGSYERQGHSKSCLRMRALKECGKGLNIPERISPTEIASMNDEYSMWDAK